MNSYALAGNVGILDLPAKKDEIGINGYIDALSKFVLKCQTPMTIAVQGGWGTGKTSVMNMVEAKVGSREDVHVVGFNTWQYSQFDLGDQLSTNLLLRIIAELPAPAQNDEVKMRLFKIAQGLARTGVRAVTPIASHVVNSIVPGSGDALRELASAVAEREQKFELSPVEAIQKLRDDFELLVRESGKRVLVFIDDLDRLEPARAVELMEAIKLFLDVPNCVFVLAIDFDVVKRGVIQKYGDDLSERKARSFFEKIIQVPFQLPTHLYRTNELLESGLKGLLSKNKHIEEYANLAANSVGTNPRATKRLINTFALLKELGNVEEVSEIDMFAMLCLQSAFPTVSDYLNTLEDVDDALPTGQNDDDADGRGSSDVPSNVEAETDAEKREWIREWGRAMPYLAILRDHFSVKANGADTFDEKRFSAATALASVTSAGVESGASQAGKWDRTADESVMRERLTAFDEAAVNWGFAFKQALGPAVNVLAQKGPVWTLQRTDVSSKKRVATLNFQKRNMSILIERVPTPVEYFAQTLEEKLRDEPVIVRREGSEENPVVRVLWKQGETIDASLVAGLLLSSGAFGKVVTE